MIRLMGLPVFLEGNIIDLGSYKLQVVEACSGLRYLYPLISIALILVYFLQVSLWKKGVVLLATIPITIFMNSARIAITGLLVKNYGTDVAEGFLHDFEGWIIFMAAFILLLLVVRVITYSRSNTTSLSGLFEMDGSTKDGDVSRLKVPASSMLKVIAALSLLAGIYTNYLVFNDQSIVVDRETFTTFPMRIANKNVSLSRLDPKVLDVLKTDDYFLGAYGSNIKEQISLYMAYYEKQKDGSALHSPRVCLPSGGWAIIDESVINIAMNEGEPKPINRVLIQKGDFTQLVYYWIQQQNNIFANEYLARISLLKSSIAENRSDGALIRLNTLVQGDDYSAADKELTEFIRHLSPILPAYLPY